MSIYTDKAGRMFVQFDYKRQTHKQYLPVGSTRSQAAKLEVKMRSDLFFEANGMKPRHEVIFEHFVNDVYLPHVLANNGPEAFDRAEKLCIQSLPFFKGKPLRVIKPSDIEAFKSWRMKLPTMHDKIRKPSTVCRELAVISKMFGLAVNDDLCDYNPCSRIEKPKFDNLQNTVLEYADEEEFFLSFDKYQGTFARDVCRLVLNTGLSQKDALGLTVFNVDLQNRMINFTRGKTKRHVAIPLNDDAYAVCLPRVKHGLLFPSPKTQKQATSVRSAMAGACRRAGIPTLTIFDLRRTFGTRLYESGADAITIAQLLGHAGLRMIPRYVRSSQNARNAVENLGNPTNKAKSAILRIAK